MKKVIITTALLAMASLTFAQKFAYVDSDYILENIPEYQVAQNKLDELSVQWQEEIEKKFAEIDKLYNEYQSEAVLLPSDMKKKREEEIVQKEKEAKELQKQRFGQNGDLFKKRQELIEPIQDKVYDAIKDISEQENYAVIFDKAGSLTMLYTNERFDISDKVLNNMGYRPGGLDSKDD
ncbi:MAG: OmpH family outer membrane protein [Bacteroidales bacterium]